MSITVSSPLPGVRVVALQDESARFKTAMLTLSLALPLCRGAAAEQAILPFLLRRGCAAYPDFAALKRQLDRLYGAQLSAGVSRLGESQVLTLQITCMDDRYALHGETVSAACAELLRGMLLEPPLQNDVFPADDIEEERRCLIETIRSEINNKRTYARARCEQLMCEGEPYATRVSGTVEETASLTAEQITAAWQRVLATAQVQILYQGSGDGAAATEPFLRGLAAIERSPIRLSVTRAAFDGRFKEKEEAMPVSQSKMVIGMRCCTSAEQQDTPAMRMVNAIFGGTAFAMLFRTVREKLSLCYYCNSSFDRLKGVGLIDSGVELEKIPAARDEIRRQFDLLRAGTFSDEDMENTRRFLVSQYLTVGDLQSTLADWYVGQVTEPEVQTPEQAAADIEAVTRERIVAAANTLELACEFRLISNGEGGNEDE